MVRLMDQLAAILERLDDRLVGILAELPCVFGHRCGELAVLIERIHQRNTGGAADAVVVLAVGRGHVHDTGAVFGGDKVVVQDLERIGVVRKKVEDRLIFQALAVRSPCRT